MKTPSFACLAAILALCPVATAKDGYFTDAQRDAILAFWSDPGRYQAFPSGDVKGEGRWKAKYTAAASVWMREYYRLRADGKVNPTRPPEAVTDDQKRWDAWVDARFALDKWAAENEASQRNAMERDQEPPAAAEPPPDPGPIPEDLAALVSPPPAFFAPVVPFTHRVVFDDGAIEYEDGVKVSDKYAFFRSEKGVMSGGSKMSSLEPVVLASLLERAGITESEARVFRAVSLLEGGFDSVNTYDTGFVSVGFIQFAALSGGAGSLGQVLLRMKTELPDEFAANFEKYGIGVGADGVLVVADPTTGLEFAGPDANRRIIIDKRLIAVFQHAGRVSDGFKICQLKTAKAMYYPLEDVVKVEFGGGVLTCQVKEIFRSEAALAILMERKVNTGNLNPLPALLKEALEVGAIKALPEAAKYEWALADFMAYRKNFLDAADLTQPERTTITLSRGNNPRDRRSGG